jgi:lysophospholipase L1-like esterase
MRTKQLAAIVACAVSCLLPATALGSTKSPKKQSITPTYYVALGDSLSAGAQPTLAGKTVPTDQGYANDLLATEQHKIKGLKLKDLGCLGESTTTMLKGGPHCTYKGVQLKEAVAFIKTHKIAFVTLDIGANDVDGCASMSGAALVTCVESGLKTVTANTPKIVKALRHAIGKQVPILGMNYYDPFLADFLGDTSGQALAMESVGLSKLLGDDLAKAFKPQKVKLVDVANAFQTFVPFTTKTNLAGHGQVPVAVARICTFTWMCALKPRGPNIHANKAGYKKIAGVFAAKL